MKQYVIDELRPGDYRKLKSCLQERLGRAELDDLFWLEIDKSIYNETQAAHVDCQPFFAAVRLEEQSIAVELLIRTMNRMRCECISYATAEQTAWLIAFLDNLVDELGIRA